LAAPYVTRILGLANLAPDIVEAVCSGSEPEGVSLARLVKGFSDDWEEQRRMFGVAEWPDRFSCPCKQIARQVRSQS